MARIPRPTRIYHITHFRNLAGIVRDGGLFSTKSIQENSTEYRSIAYEGIQDRRAVTTVPVGAAGTLHDYVPFYFAPRSPMLSTISRGNVPNCPDGQTPVVHLVSNVEKVRADGLQFVFTDGHGIMALTNYYDDLSSLETLDWELMRDRFWADTLEDPDRKRRRQAEFLVRNFFPWSLITEIGVINDSVHQEVEELVARSVPIAIRQNWYY